MKHKDDARLFQSLSNDDYAAQGMVLSIYAYWKLITFSSKQRKEKRDNKQTHFQHRMKERITSIFVDALLSNLLRMYHMAPKIEVSTRLTSLFIRPSSENIFIRRTRTKRRHNIDELSWLSVITSDRDPRLSSSHR